MPASGIDYSWPQKLPLFQVYGTKRKADGDTSHAEPLYDHELSGFAKRRCTWSNDEHEMVDSCMEINHNSLPAGHITSPTAETDEHLRSLSERLGQTQERCILSDYPGIQHPARTNVNTVIQSDYPVTVLERRVGAQDMMDLCDEVYTHTQQMEDACTSMDSDCVPNPAQYYEQQTSSFCQDYCGVGTSSPTSGRVRCYCKPSWEGMLDMKPYVSDIY